MWHLTISLSILWISSFAFGFTPVQSSTSTPGQGLRLVPHGEHACDPVNDMLDSGHQFYENCSACDDVNYQAPGCAEIQDVCQDILDTYGELLRYWYRHCYPTPG